MDKGTSSSNLPPSRVLLWTNSRCCSSIFERSIRELEGVKALYEPHMGAFYWGPERMRIEYEKDLHLIPSYSSHTYDYVDSMIAKYGEHRTVFVKNMAFYIPKERFSKYVEGDFSEFEHSFLIRDPEKAIVSNWKACIKCDYDPILDEGNSKGFICLYEMFEFIRSTGKKVTVVDANDLIRNPEYIMEQYCNRMELPYDKKMLSWTPGVVKEWTKYKYYKEWHWRAMYSSGFGTPATVPEPDAPNATSSVGKSLPAELVEEIQKALPYYQAMRKYCIKLPDTA